MTNSDPSLSPDERMMAMLAHILAIFTGFIAPLVIYLIRKDQSRFVAFHAMQSLMLVGAYIVIMIVLYILVFIITLVTMGIGAVLYIPLMILAFVPMIFQILAGVHANNGEWYEYPVIGQMARKQVGF